MDRWLRLQLLKVADGPLLCFHLPSVSTEMALLGQELMLCRAADQDLLREVRCSLRRSPPSSSRLPCLQGGGGVQRQLLFLQQLLSLVPGSQQTSGSSVDTELLLGDMFAAENVWQLSGMLTPTLEPRTAPSNPAHPARPSSGSLCAAADVCSLLQVTSSALQQLQAEVRPPSLTFSDLSASL